MNSRSKGCRGEREFAQWLRENLGCEARRGQQFSGSPDSPDVVHSLEGIHFEVKRTERLSVYEAMEQAERDCGEDVPIVAHRRNRKEWLLIIKAEDLTRLVNPADLSLPRIDVNVGLADSDTAK